MTKYRLPDGFTPASTTPNGSLPRVDVVFEPGNYDTHYELGTCRYEHDRREGARWRTANGDSITDYGKRVLGWRRQRDDMKIRIEEPSPADEEGYRRAIDLLAKESNERALGGEMDTRPKNVSFVSEMFGVAVATVTEDYEARSKELFASRR